MLQFMRDRNFFNQVLSILLLENSLNPIKRIYRLRSFRCTVYLLLQFAYLLHRFVFALFSKYLLLTYLSQNFLLEIPVPKYGCQALLYIFAQIAI